jgi:hypothetical protein
MEAVVIPQRRGVPEHADDDGEHSPGNRQHPACSERAVPSRQRHRRRNNPRATLRLVSCTP